MLEDDADLRLVAMTRHFRPLRLHENVLFHWESKISCEYPSCTFTSQQTYLSRLLASVAFTVASSMALGLFVLSSFLFTEAAAC